MRRLFIITALLLGLLGPAIPVLACAIGPAAQDCCPSGAPSPCAPDSEQPATSAELFQCCSLAPPAESALRAVVARDVDAPAQHLTGGSSPLPPPARLHLRGNTYASALLLESRPPTLPLRGDTYLRTGRLRL
jgi:hypothetical protein